MPSIIDSILIEIGFDLRAFRKGLHEADTAAKRTKDDWRRHQQELGSTATVMGGIMGGLIRTLGLLGAAFEAFKLAEMVNQTREANVALGKLAEAIGIPPQEMSKWMGMARAAGGTGEEIGNAMLNASKGWERFKATGEAPPWMKWLAPASKGGLDIDVTKGVLNMYLDLADKVKGLSSAQRAVVLESFGITSPALIDLFAKGRTEIERLLKVQEGLGPITEKDTKAMERLTEVFENMRTTARRLGADISDLLEKPLEWLIGWIQRFVQGTDPLTRWLHRGEDWLFGGHFAPDVYNEGGPWWMQHWVPAAPGAGAFTPGVMAAPSPPSESAVPGWMLGQPPAAPLAAAPPTTTPAPGSTGGPILQAPGLAFPPESAVPGWMLGQPPAAPLAAALPTTTPAPGSTAAWPAAIAPEAAAPAWMRETPGWIDALRKAWSGPVLAAVQSPAAATLSPVGISAPALIPPVEGALPPWMMTTPSWLSNLFGPSRPAWTPEQVEAIKKAFVPLPEDNMPALPAGAAPEFFRHHSMINTNKKVSTEVGAINIHAAAASNVIRHAPASSQQQLEHFRFAALASAGIE